MAKPQTISVLNIATTEQYNLIMRHIYREAGITQVFSTEDASGMFDIINGASIDVVTIQESLPEVDAADICRTIRTSSKSPNIAMPLVAALMVPSIQRFIEICHAGVNEVLTIPTSPRKLLVRMAAAFHDNRRFIVSENYVGPDRSISPSKGAEAHFRRPTGSAEGQAGNSGRVWKQLGI